MYSITWIEYTDTGARIASVTTPSATVAWTLYWAMRSARWDVRIWKPGNKLAA